jgi:hypothetical protein
MGVVDTRLLAAGTRTEVVDGDDDVIMSAINPQTAKIPTQYIGLQLPLRECDDDNGDSAL